MWNIDGAYGIIGVGVGSGLWQSFTNPATKIATYSVSLARFSNPLGLERGIQATSYPSNITFGSANDEAYNTSTSLEITALTNDTYALSDFGFGIIYQDNGVD